MFNSILLYTFIYDKLKNFLTTQIYILGQVIVTLLYSRSLGIKPVTMNPTSLHIWTGWSISEVTAVVTSHSRVYVHRHVKRNLLPALSVFTVMIAGGGGSSDVNTHKTTWPQSLNTRFTVTNVITTRFA